jgi:hypothetical protein
LTGRERRVLVDRVEERAQLIDVLQFARQRRGQIEAEAVDVHLGDPVAQAVHEQLQRMRMHHVERVAAAGEIHVVPRIARHDPVVGEIVDAAERERRAGVIALRGVVVDHVEDHLDAGVVQILDHLLELAHHIAGARRVGSRSPAPARRNPACCSPSNCAALVDQMPVVRK